MTMTRAKQRAARRVAAVLAAAAWLAAGWGSAVRGEPRMPGGFEAGWTQGKNNTWRETGTLEETYEAGVRSMGACLEGQGYRLEYDIPMVGGGRVLQQWEKEGERIILMLWDMGDGRTGCSWGVSE